MQLKLPFRVYGSKGMLVCLIIRKKNGMKYKTHHSCWCSLFTFKFLYNYSPLVINSKVWGAFFELRKGKLLICACNCVHFIDEKFCFKLDEVLLC